MPKPKHRARCCHPERRARAEIKLEKLEDEPIEKVLERVEAAKERSSAAEPAPAEPEISVGAGAGEEP